MTATDVVQHFGAGSISKAAKAIPVSRVTLHRWMKDGVSERWQLKLQKQSAGALKADPQVVEKYKELLAA